MALAHAVSNAVEAAYRRGDMLEKRRQLMAAWADYVSIDNGSVVRRKEKLQNLNQSAIHAALAETLPCIGR